MSQMGSVAYADDWMELVSLTVDGYPCLDKKDYTANLHQYIADKKALILRDDDMAIGVMGFSPDTGSIDFLAVHPQYRHLGITKLFLDKLAEELLCGKEITLTTFAVSFNNALYWLFYGNSPRRKLQLWKWECKTAKKDSPYLFQLYSGDFHIFIFPVWRRKYCKGICREQ